MILWDGDKIFGHDIHYEDGELKPCPFCGGKARATMWYGYSPTYDDYSINVYVCGCMDCDVKFMTPWENVAVEMWNERV